MAPPDLAPLSEPALSPGRPVLSLSVRGLEEDDWPYVAKTWTLSTANSPTAKERYARRYNTLRSRGARFLIACDPTHTQLILGFLCFEDFEGRHDSCSILHFAYTKDKYRRQGVFRSLLAAAGFGPHRTILCSHWTRSMNEVASRIRAFTPILP